MSDEIIVDCATPAGRALVAAILEAHYKHSSRETGGMDRASLTLPLCTEARKLSQGVA